jgi:hypothetical protein
MLMAAAARVIPYLLAPKRSAGAVAGPPGIGPSARRLMIDNAVDRDGKE